MSLSTHFLEQALQAAQSAADAARAIILPAYQTRDFCVTIKADATPVTQTDREAESAIKNVLRAAFPQHAFYGEEEGHEGQSDFIWLIDPIDGTKAFVRGYPFFSTQIALWYDGEVVLGVSDACAYGERAWAIKDGGAFLNGKPIHVANTQEFGPQTAISTGNLKTLAADTRWDILADLVRRVGRVRGYGDFLHYHLLAQGAIDLVIESDLNILDIAPLVVIVREAGGVFTDLAGNPVDLNTSSALAGTPALHEQALAAFGSTPG